MPRGFVVLGLLVALLVPTSAAASLRLDHYVLPNGTGMLIANPAGLTSWERCAADGACVPFDDGDADIAILRVPADPAGVTYRAHRDGATLTSEMWQGGLRAVAPPSVDGPLRVGGTVRAVPATWAGGWGREADWLQLQVCPSPGGPGCRVLEDRIKHPCGPAAGRTIPGRYAGWWLVVADARIDREQPFTLEGYPRPEGVWPHVAAPGVAVAVAGRIGRGTARPDPCLAAESIPLGLRRIVAPGARGRLELARVRCPFACTATITVRQRGRTRLTVTRRLRARETNVALPRRRAYRVLRSGPATVSVAIDGTTARRDHRVTVRLR